MKQTAVSIQYCGRNDDKKRQKEMGDERTTTGEERSTSEGLKTCEG